MLVAGDRVEAVEPVIPGEAAGRVIQAGGLALCPGFIDLHSHADLTHTLPPSEQRGLVKGRLAQGITSEIVGNCGLGVFPCPSEALELMRPVVDWMTPPGAASWPGTPPAWTDLEGYFDLLERQGTWANVGALQPHGPLRMEACGLQRAADGSARRRIGRRLREAMDAGAFGASVGLIYPPGMYASTDELLDLAMAMASAEGAPGLLASHIRGSSETLHDAV